MKCRNRGSNQTAALTRNGFRASALGRCLLGSGLRAARPTEVPKAFGAYTSLLHDLKKAFSSALRI
jgi:hypothetical protein